MATEEMKIQLAKQIAEKCSGISRNEWMRWVQIAERYGLHRALNWAKQLGGDQTLRPNIRHANRHIAKAVKANQQELKSLSKHEKLETFGYVGRLLKIGENTHSKKQHGRYKGRRRR